MNRRSEERIEKEFLAYTRESQPELLGVITNISRRGIKIESQKKMELDREISFYLADKHDIYPLTCEVKWVIKYNKKPRTQPIYATGMKVLEAPVEYLNFVEYQKYSVTKRPI